MDGKWAQVMHAFFSFDDISKFRALNEAKVDIFHKNGSFFINTLLKATAH